MRKGVKKDNPNLNIKDNVNAKRENTELINIGYNNIGEVNNEIFRINNKREEANHKLSERHLVGQLNQNPFMINNDYIKDLDIQQNFLMPKNSNNDKKS